MKNLILIESLEEVLQKNYKYLNHGDLVELLQEALEALKEEIQWRIAVDNELASAHMVSTDNPIESIRKVIDWNTSVQLDPRVSSSALNLYKEGFDDGVKTCKDLAVKITEQKVKDLVTLLNLEL